jgi:hypothetical protein
LKAALGREAFTWELRGVIISRYYFQPLLENSPGLAMKALVHAIWNKFRIGRRETTEPFLRVSFRVEFDERPLFLKQNLRDAQQNDPQRVDEAFVVSSDPIPKGILMRPNLCLYIMREKPEEVTKECLIKKLDEAPPFKRIYVTERPGKFPINSKDWKDNLQQDIFDFGNSEGFGISKESLVLLVAGRRTYEEESEVKRVLV